MFKDKNKINVSTKEKNKKEGVIKKFSPIIFPVSALLIATVILSIVLPIALTNKDSEKNVEDPVIIGKYLTAEKTNKLAFEATSALESIELLTDSPILYTKKLLSEEKKQEIIDTLPTIDLIISNESNFKTTLIESKHKDYAYELKIEFTDRYYESTIYNLLFNIIETKTKEEKDEIETIIKYKGVLGFESKMYDFIAVNEQETENAENESELSFNLFLDKEKITLFILNKALKLNMKALKKNLNSLSLKIEDQLKSLRLKQSSTTTSRLLM